MIPLSAAVAIMIASNLAGSISSIASAIASFLIVLERGFGADVTVSEKGRDDLAISENPVEQGAAITDHAYKKPAVLTVRVGYSNSSRAANGNPLYVQEMYVLLLAMQAARVPFGMVTGKRVYQNLLISSIDTETDEKWETASIFTVNMREIILVNTQIVSVPSTANMQNPGANGATQNMGSAPLLPATVNTSVGALP